MHQPTTTPEPGTRPDTPTPGTATVAQHPPRAEAGYIAEPVQPTGPVDFLPGPPGVRTPPPTATTPEPRRARGARKGRERRKAREARKARGPRPGGEARALPGAARTPRQRAALSGAALAVLSLLLLELGLALHADTGSLWPAVPLWSAFATLAGVLGLLPFAGRVLPSVRVRPDGAWRVAAAGLTGLAVFWVLVVLPDVDSDRGFVLTVALAVLGMALWIAPGRRP